MMSCPDGWLSHFFAACDCVRESCRRDIARIEREIARRCYCDEYRGYMMCHYCEEAFGKKRWKGRRK